MRTRFFIVIFLVALITTSISNSTFASISKNTSLLNKPYATINYTFFNINNISTYIYNNGEADIRPDGNSGFIFPKGSYKPAVFASGFVWGGKINNEIRVGGSTFASGLIPGKILEDGTPEDPNQSSVRVYRVRPDYETAELQSEIDDEEMTEEEIRTQYELDWNEWPAEDGAPFNDLDNDGVYNPQIDIPGVIGADQTLWFVANDLDSNVCKGLYGSLPMGIEMQVTIWGYADRGIYDNMIFKKYKLINKGDSQIDSMYISIWSDPDIGDASDDLVGCDTLMNLAYVYNGGMYDGTYGVTPPAVGFVLLKGSKGDNNENLDMTSFHNMNKHGNDNFHEPNLGEYEGSLKYYNFMQGRIGNGNLFPIPNVFGGGTTKFPFSGDPISGSGFIDGVTTYPTDRRMAIGSGPFTLAVADTQEIVFAELAAQGRDYLNSLQLLKYYVKQIPENLDYIRDNKKFQIPIPPQPDFSFKSNIHTNDISISIENRDHIENFTNNGYTFQGYNIYQISTDFYDKYYERTIGNLKIATYDIADGITEIYGETIDTKTREIISILFQEGTDSGVDEFSNLNHDFVTNTPFIKGKRYTYAITAYYYNQNSGNYPSTIESLPKDKSFTFKNSFEGVAYGDTLTVENIFGSESDFLVEPIVLNPHELTDHIYQVSIYDNEFIAYWDLLDVTLNKVIIKNQLVKNYRLNFRTLHDKDDREPMVDGMLIFVARKYSPQGNFKYNGISLIKYDDSSLSSPYIFHDLEYDYHRTVYLSSSPDNKIEDFSLDAKYILPYDYELRFTDDENFAIDYWNNNKIISVPFELWNIGIDTPDDPVDDVRMIPFVKMQNDSSKWTTRIDLERPYSMSSVPTPGLIYWMKPDIENGGYSEFARICNAVGIGGEYDTTMDNSLQGFYADFQGDFNYVMGNMGIVGFNYNGTNTPPIETIIRFSTFDPVSETDIYTFKSEIQNPTTLPYEYELFQNYPNPFNSNTTIRFSIRESGPVKLTIYNLLGQKVKDLVNRKMNTGEYEVTFNANNLSSGIYFYKISTEHFVEAKKMILLK